MDEDMKEELEALVVGFLQQGLKENPNGLSVREFEKSFPLKCDEPDDWYKRYGKKSALEALECIPNAVKLAYNSRFGQNFICLNKKSDKIDSHLVDLITNQKSSNKKSFSRPSSRALLSFSLNRQYSSHHRGNNYTTRLNYDQQYRSDSYSKKDSHHELHSHNHPAPFSASNGQKQFQKSAHDPRLRGSSSAVSKSMHPPQVHSKITSQNHISKTKTSAPTPAAKPSQPTLPTAKIEKLPVPRPETATRPKPNVKASKEENSVLVSRKHHLRQKICSLLSRKYSEIKLLHLAGLYQLEFEESIDSASFGYPNVTSLLQDPIISPHIQINYKAPFVTISAKVQLPTNGGDHLNNRISQITDSENIHSSGQVSATRAKLEAIDKFNTKSMVQSLERLPPLRELPLQNLEVEDTVQYKTMRIIFRAQDMTLKIDEWPDKFDQETKFKINIRDYGFKTLLEFFRKLASELPIKLKLNNKSEWVALANMALLSDWLNEKMNKGKYRAMTAIDAHYELVAFPNDVYTFTSAQELSGLNYLPAYILSVKRSTSLWVQLRTPKKIEGHLCVEASMTCYEDYKSRDLLSIPQAFIRPGFPCAVMDAAQQRWCRALILKAPEKVEKNCEITALLVDYGITRSFVTSQLLCLMKAHLKIPVGPIYAKLAGVENEENMVIQHRAKRILHEYTSPPVTLACKFLRAIHSNEANYLPRTCFEVSLVDTRSGKDCNIAEDINLPRDSD